MTLQYLNLVQIKSTLAATQSLLGPNSRLMAHLLRRGLSVSRTLKAQPRLTMNSADLQEIFHPPINREMKELDRSFFRKVVPTSAATIFDSRQTANIRNALTKSQDSLHIPGIRPIVDDDTSPGAKCVILKPEIKPDQPDAWSSQLTSLVNEKSIQVRPYDLVLKYENWTMQNILEAILPDLPLDQKETPGGFAQVGHIAHVNLRSQYLPWKHLIAQVLLDKNPTLRTVINKTLDVGSESEFRTFPYEILAGDEDLDVTQMEQGCEFRFNFAEVYWNSRLGTEHERVVAKFQPGETVCDVMAGVGPFAIPAGRKKVFVWANDLNPHSFAGLQWAVRRNKVSDFVSASNVDGRFFIRDATQQLASSPRKVEQYPNVKIPRGAPVAVMEELALKRLKALKVHEEPRSFDHYVMNLPASAVEFLDAFVGLYRGREAEFAPYTGRKLPMIHVYTFQTRRDTDEEEAQEICDRISNRLGGQIKTTDRDVEILDIRLVSPKKKYYRASFRLPANVAFAFNAPATLV